MTTTDWDSELRQRTRDLAAAAAIAIPRYVERSVRAVVGRRGGSLDEGQEELVRIAGQTAVAAIVPAIERLADDDVDAQQTTPLALLREAFHFPTQLMQAWGEVPEERDAFSRRAFPDDHYAILPSSFREIDGSLFEPGLAWGAAKAKAHIARHGPPAKTGGAS